MGDISEEDRKIIERQLERNPKGLVDISFRCQFGFPAVLKTRPLIRNGQDFEVFPTLYWLSCPKRVEEVARIESRGYVGKLEAEIASDSRLKREYLEAERRYLESQQSLLSEEDRRFIEDKGLEDALTRGIGGIESEKHLKCLHLHLAHQLAEENVLGKILQERFALGDCSPDKVRCRTLQKKDS